MVTAAAPLTPALLQAILAQYALRPAGPHGVRHWARVLENGRRLAKSTGANRPVVELFSVFHDACRESDGSDPHHGIRGADLAARLHGECFRLPDEDLELLQVACSYHTQERSHSDVTVRTCWDADRLDLARVGITPRAKYLCTPQAKAADLIAWAIERGESRRVPRLVRSEWGLEPSKL